MVQIWVIILAILTAPIALLLVLRITLSIIAYLTQRKSTLCKDATPGSFTFLGINRRMIIRIEELQ